MSPSITIALCQVNSWFCFLLVLQRIKILINRAEPPNILTSSDRKKFNFITPLLSLTVISNKHPSSKSKFQSRSAIRNEIIRHMVSNYWYIIHPYSKLKWVFHNFHPSNVFGTQFTCFLSIEIGFIGALSWHSYFICCFFTYHSCMHFTETSALKYGALPSAPCLTRFAFSISS